MQPFSLFAPAKVNLALHVLGRRADGYHDLDSIVVFADVGDRLTFTPSDRFAIAVSGPFAAALPQAEDNIIAKSWAAAQAIAAVCNKHGWMQGGMMGRWGEEIACVAILGPLALQTVKGVKADLAAREKDKPKPPEQIAGPVIGQPIPAEALGQKTVTFGSA